MAQPWVRKGRIDPIPYVSKALVARVPSGVFITPFDHARANGGKRKNKDSPPLPIFLQVQSSHRRRESKRKMLDRMINPTPKPLNLGFKSTFKVY